MTLTLDDVNAIGLGRSSISHVQIANSTAVGDQPNDLFDQRDVLVDKLASLGNVSVTTGTLNSIDVTFGGATLVTGPTSAATLVEADLTSLSSGKLAGLISLRDTVLPGYLARLSNT